MVDANEFIGNNVTQQLVKESPTKRLVFLSAGAGKEMQDHKVKLNMLVEIDGKQKNYIPNVTTMKNCIAAWGSDTARWVGKSLSLEIGTVNGKEAIIGKPVL